MILMNKVCVAFGTRPEASKMAPVIYALQKHADLFPYVLVTGQHREQLDSMLEVFEVIPDDDLRLMTARQTLSDLMGKIVPKVAGKLREMKPKYVLVHGDTLTTFAVALSAYFEGIPIAHVEAGLRSFNLLEPFPEEANRRLTDVLSTLDLPPTHLAKQNLLREGKSEKNMIVTGNTAVDAVNYVSKFAHLPKHLEGASKLITITMHRRENLSIMKDLAGALAKIAKKHSDYTFVYPVHLNPEVREKVWSTLNGIPNIVLEEPLGYSEMIALLAKSELIITDSGGIQEEGAALGVPVAVLRNVTERPEGVDGGVLKLAGNNPETAYQVIDEILSDNDIRSDMRNRSNPYGDGFAGDRIVKGIAWSLGLGDKPQDWQPS